MEIGACFSYFHIMFGCDLILCAALNLYTVIFVWIMGGGMMESFWVLITIGWTLYEFSIKDENWWVYFHFLKKKKIKN